MVYSMNDVNKRLKEIKDDGCQVKLAKVEVNKEDSGYNTHVTVKYLNDWNAECGFGYRVGEGETLAAAKKRQASCTASLKKRGIQV